MNLVTINEQILINQLAQKIISYQEGERWFTSLTPERQQHVLRELNCLIVQAGPLIEDTVSAIADSGLKKTYTPCVLLRGGQIDVQLAKIASLPKDEFGKAFRLLIALLALLISGGETHDHSILRIIGGIAICATPRLLRRLSGNISH